MALNASDGAHLGTTFSGSWLPSESLASRSTVAVAPWASVTKSSVAIGGIDDPADFTVTVIVSVVWTTPSLIVTSTSYEPLPTPNARNVTLPSGVNDTEPSVSR